MPREYRGSCHCGAVRFRAALDPHQAFVCDCSICRRKGSIMVRVESDAFKIDAGEAQLSLYQFNSQVAKHYFCSCCGIHTFHRPRAAPTLWAINLRCLEDIDPQVLQDAQRF